MPWFRKRRPAAAERLSWEAGPPLLSLLRGWDGPGTLDLPDEESAVPGEVRFASGAWDGILTHHVGHSDEHEEARLVLRAVDALRRLIRADDDRARTSLYEAFRAEPLAPHADALVEELVRQQDFGPEDLRPHARWLVRVAAHREPLKLGIVLLGLAGTPEDLDDLVVLGRHDEFTLFAAVAASRLLDDPVDAWWTMARGVHGWGKVHLVERLCQHAENRPDLQGWLLRHGCANEIMPEYLAYACAIAGRMAEALSAGEVDDELLDGAGLIVVSLLNGGPAEDIDSYEDGVRAVESLLGHLESCCDRLGRLDVVRTIRGWLAWQCDDAGPGSAESTGLPDREAEEMRRAQWERRSALGWTEDVRAELAARCDAIRRRPEWPERVRAAYRTDDEIERHLAWGIAPLVGVDLWEDGFASLAKRPLNASLYWNLLSSEDRERVRRVLDFAEEALPLAAIASGPAQELGLGPGYEAHSCLDFLVQEMRRADVFRAKLVAAALRSPVVRNRNLAITALENHPVEEWGQELRAVVVRAVRVEPDKPLRDRMKSLVERAR